MWNKNLKKKLSFYKDTDLGFLEHSVSYLKDKLDSLTEVVLQKSKTILSHHYETWRSLYGAEKKLLLLCWLVKDNFKKFSMVKNDLHDTKKEM